MQHNMLNFFSIFFLGFTAREPILNRKIGIEFGKFLGFDDENFLGLQKYLGLTNENFFWVEKIIWGLLMKNFLG